MKTFWSHFSNTAITLINCDNFGYYNRDVKFSYHYIFNVQRICNLEMRLSYCWPTSATITAWRRATCHLTVCGFMVWLLHSPLFCKASSFWEPVCISKSPSSLVCICVFVFLSFVCLFVCSCGCVFYHGDLSYPRHQAMSTKPNLVSWH